MGLFSRRAGGIVAFFRIEEAVELDQQEQAPIPDDFFGSALGGSEVTSSVRWVADYAQALNIKELVTSSQRRAKLIVEHEQKYGVPPVEPYPGGIRWVDWCRE